MKVGFDSDVTIRRGDGGGPQCRHDNGRGCGGSFEEDSDDDEDPLHYYFETSKKRVVKISIQDIIDKAHTGEAFLGEEVEGDGGRTFYRFKLRPQDAAELAKEEDVTENTGSMSFDDDMMDFEYEPDDEKAPVVSFQKSDPYFFQRLD